MAVQKEREEGRKERKGREKRKPHGFLVQTGSYYPVMQDPAELKAPSSDVMTGAEGRRLPRGGWEQIAQKRPHLGKGRRGGSGSSKRCLFSR